jgi:hypothetical protein
LPIFTRAALRRASIMSTPLLGMVPGAARGARRKGLSPCVRGGEAAPRDASTAARQPLSAAAVLRVAYVITATY